MNNASIRVRLTLWYGSALALILLLFAVALYLVMSRALREQVDASLDEAAAVAIRTLGEHRFGPFLIFEDLSQDFPEIALLDKFFPNFWAGWPSHHSIITHSESGNSLEPNSVSCRA